MSVTRRLRVGRRPAVVAGARGVEAGRSRVLRERCPTLRARGAMRARRFRPPAESGHIRRLCSIVTSRLASRDRSRSSPGVRSATGPPYPVDQSLNAQDGKSVPQASRPTARRAGRRSTGSAPADRRPRGAARACAASSNDRNAQHSCSARTHARTSPSAAASKRSSQAPSRRSPASRLLAPSRRSHSHPVGHRRAGSACTRSAVPSPAAIVTPRAPVPL